MDDDYGGPWTVAVFLCDRAYGGPEEGGWWYDCGEPAPEFAQHLRGFDDLQHARSYSAELNDGVCERANIGRRESGSVLSTGRYYAEVCEGLPRPYPECRPRYE